MKPVLFAAIGLLFLISGCLPPAPSYPYEPKAQILQEGQQISDSLEGYIKRWLDGQVSSQIPNKYIPKGIVDNKNFYLKNPDEVTEEEVWATRLSKPVNFDSCVGGLPDPNVTYLLLGPSLAPFGSKLVIEGDFPYCRFFSIQVSAPLDGVTYTASRFFGAAEVSIADADIAPLPGNVNPFMPGANRLATNRKYRMEFNLTKGDAVALNGNAFKQPYRQYGNQRAASLIVYQGPWGVTDYFGNRKPDGGKWDVGNVWLRIYAPDNGRGPLGGVAKPKMYYQLPDGRKYFIGANFNVLTDRANTAMKARENNTTPNPNVGGPSDGWYKSYGIVRSILNGACQVNGWARNSHADKVNAIDLGVCGRGEFQAAPGNYEPHATTNNYASYLGRNLTIQKGMVAVLVGKLPTTPRTLQSNNIMQRAQLRYWSICGYDNSLEAPVPGSAINGIMDEQLTLDNNRNYMIVYSRTADRPSNATTTNGASWVNWGPTAELGLMIRYLAVSPDWDFEKSPQEWHLPWATTDWAGSRYDSTLIGVNSHKGFMDCYLPRVVVMTKAEFEALGNNYTAATIPAWIDKSNKAGINEAYNKPVEVSSIWDNTGNYRASYLVDGKLNTRWSSKWGGTPATATIDLQKSVLISGIKLFWESAYAKKYSVESSIDGTNWQMLYQTAGGSGGIELIKNLSATGRYLRINCISGWLPSVSLWEVEVVSNEMPCSPLPISVPVNKGKTALNIFPNPAGSYANISLPEHGVPYQQQLLQVFNTQGRLVHQTVPTNNPCRVDCMVWPAGVYTAKLTAGDKAAQGVFVKNR